MLAKDYSKYLVEYQRNVRALLKDIEHDPILPIQIVNLMILYKMILVEKGHEEYLEKQLEPYKRIVDNANDIYFLEEERQDNKYIDPFIESAKTAKELIQKKLDNIHEKIPDKESAEDIEKLIYLRLKEYLKFKDDTQSNEFFGEILAMIYSDKNYCGYDEDEHILTKYEWKNGKRIWKDLKTNQKPQGIKDFAYLGWHDNLKPYCKSKSGLCKKAGRKIKHREYRLTEESEKATEARLRKRGFII